MKYCAHGGKRLVVNDFRSIALLSFASFYFLCVDIIADNAVMLLLSEKAVMPIHIAYLFVMAGGFLLFSPIRRTFLNRMSHTAALSVLYSISVISLFCIVIIKLKWLFISAVMICLFTAGMIGSATYYYCAVSLRFSAFKGRVCGIGIGGAALLQILLMIFDVSSLAAAFVLTISLSLAFCILLRMPKNTAEPETNHVPAAPFPKKSTVFIIICIVCVISVMGGINDATLVMMYTKKQLTLYSFPRAFYLVGAVVAGFIADYKNRRYFPITILCIMLCATVGLLFMNSDILLNINACIYSLLAGFAIIYFTVTFFDIAVQSEYPDFWAGMGRALRLIFLAIGTIFAELALKNLPFNYTIGFFTFLSVCLVCLFWFGGFLFDPNNGVSHDASEEHFNRFSETYRLTKRESDVLERLINTEDGTQAIADALYISRRVLQRYIAFIYEKTGTKTRAGLIRLYTLS